MNAERKEALWRLVVGIVSGIILSLWKIVVFVVVVFHFFYVLFTGKRNKELAKFCHIFNDQVYKFLKYMSFATNRKVFPFVDLGTELDPIDMTKSPHEETKKKKR